MFKIFDIEKGCIVKEKTPCVVTITLESDMLNLPYREMYEKIKQFVKNCNIGEYTYWIFEVTGKCDKEDIADFYNTIESILVDFHSGEKEREEKRLGTFGLPEKINLRTINLLRLMNYEPNLKGFNFEVSKADSFWKKRMVK